MPRKVLNSVISDTCLFPATLRWQIQEISCLKILMSAGCFLAGKRGCLCNFHEIIKRTQRNRPEFEGSSTGRVFLKLSPGFSHCSSCVPTYTSPSASSAIKIIITFFSCGSKLSSIIRIGAEISGRYCRSNEYHLCCVSEEQVAPLPSRKQTQSTLQDHNRRCSEQRDAPYPLQLLPASLCFYRDGTLCFRNCSSCLFRCLVQ